MPHCAIGGRNGYVPAKLGVGLAKNHFLKRGLPLRAHRAIPPGRTSNTVSVYGVLRQMTLRVIRLPSHLQWVLPIAT
jgi:hypothetical protein